MNDMTTANAARTIDPRRNPSYPQRTHTAEKPQWQALLQEWTKKVEAAASRLSILGNHPKRSDFEFVYAQMRGGLDQIADAVRRMPGEVGELYEEDKHRVDQAVQSLERSFAKWATLG